MKEAEARRGLNKLVALPVERVAARCRQEQEKQVGRAGLEPATKCLKGACSTIELTTLLEEPHNIAHPAIAHQGVLGRDAPARFKKSGASEASLRTGLACVKGKRNLDGLFATFLGADTDGFLDR